MAGSEGRLHEKILVPDADARGSLVVEPDRRRAAHRPHHVLAPRARARPHPVDGRPDPSLRLLQQPAPCVGLPRNRTRSCRRKAAAGARADGAAGARAPVGHSRVLRADRTRPSRVPRHGDSLLGRRGAAGRGDVPPRPQLSRLRRSSRPLRDRVLLRGGTPGLALLERAASSCLSGGPHRLAPRRHRDDGRQRDRRDAPRVARARRPPADLAVPKPIRGGCWSRRDRHGGAFRARGDLLALQPDRSSWRGWRGAGRGEPRLSPVHVRSLRRGPLEDRTRGTTIYGRHVRPTTFRFRSTTIARAR